MRAVPAGARPKVTEVREEGGFGLTGLCAGAPVAFGRPELFERLGISAPPPPAHDGPIAGASRDGVFLGWLLSTDAPRPEAAAELGELRILGLTRQVLLTGDRTAVARRIGAEPGIPEVCAEVLPEQKMHRVQQETRNGFPPLVVGDGINDSLALKAGAVGIAMGAQGPLTPRSCLGRLTGLASLADAANGGACLTERNRFDAPDAAPEHPGADPALTSRPLIPTAGEFDSLRGLSWGRDLRFDAY